MANQHTHIPWPERFWAQTRPGPSGCLEWTGSMLRKGYGRVQHDRARRLAHRVAFALHNGREPGPELDHLCHNRRCVNVAHLREVTHKQNMENGANALKARCRHGHPFDEANTHRIPSRPGKRICRICERARERRRRLARRKTT